MWKLNQFLSGDDEEREESFLEEESDGFCSLSPTQRMYAFAASLIAGLALYSLIVFAKPIKFALLFTFGNVLAVGSTAFLIGPGRQLGMMFDPARIYATAIYIGCVVLALICALLVQPELYSFRSENGV
ncbi:vesicle transport protein SFT2B-like isoform X1 [Populus alba x Populus x berolinensis]|nr:vesicle transport protein SFT2B-like isoform X1 [Populus alba x Populus x berolinensis]